jgi:hypothetical protein
MTAVDLRSYDECADCGHYRCNHNGDRCVVEVLTVPPGLLEEELVECSCLTFVEEPLETEAEERARLNREEREIPVRDFLQVSGTDEELVAAGVLCANCGLSRKAAASEPCIVDWADGTPNTASPSGRYPIYGEHLFVEASE